MHKFVVDVVQRVLVAAETKVAFFIEPDDRRVEVLDQYPLPNVELLAVDQQRVFDVLLDDELAIFSQTVVCDIVEIVETFDASAS